MVEYTLTRSNRKTLAIYVKNGYVDVRAPLKLPKQKIDTFVHSKENWIEKKIEISLEQIAKRESFSLHYGEDLWYQGEKHPIIAKNEQNIGFKGQVFVIPPDLTAEEIKIACIRIYRLLAKRELTAQTVLLSKKMGVQADAIKINGSQSIWGSCSSAKKINLSWRLIMTEVAVRDYVIVHELAHLMEMNHSKNFWALVEKMIPDYQEQRSKLREFGKMLAIEDWRLS